MTRLLVLLNTIALLTLGCAERRAPRTAGDPSLPRLGWVIMHGDRDNPDQEFGCQSNPRSACVIRASASGHQALSEVHLYYHAGRTRATYAGTVTIGFFANATTSAPMKTNATVNPGDVGNQSVVGVVTDMPGLYTMRIDVTAVNEAGVEQRLREDVPIEVQSAAATRAQ
jgi:hypothetical protein